MMKSSCSCIKENVLPVSAKKSKIPLPSTTTTGKKAANPNTAPKNGRNKPGSLQTRGAGNQRVVPKSSHSQSPACKRAVLGELPKEQKTIVRAREALETGMGMKTERIDRVLETRLGLDADRKGLFSPTDQSGIHFESDASALESIMNETGIQSISTEPDTSQQTMRHTLTSANRKSLRSSKVEETHSERMEAFKRVCDEYIRRSSIMQPHSKRQCMDSSSRIFMGRSADPPVTNLFANMRGAMASISENSKPSKPVFKDITSHPGGKDPIPFREPRPSDILLHKTPLRVAATKRKVAVSPAMQASARVKIEKADPPSCHTPVRLVKATDAPMPNNPAHARLSKIGTNSPMAGTPARILKVADTTPALATPQRVKIVETSPTVATPQRVKVVDASSAVVTPQRVKVVDASPVVVTPQRVRITDASPASAVPPPQRVPYKPEPEPMFHVPQRVSRESNAHTSPLRGPRTSLSASTSKKKNLMRRNWLTNENLGCSPSFDSGRRGSTIGAAMRKVGTSSPQGLKAMWKTKKTSDKTPVKKEVLTSVVGHVNEEATESRVSPILRQAYTSAKKKKLTWADTLESCWQTPPRPKTGKKSLFHSDSGGSDDHVHRKVASASVHTVAGDWTACSGSGGSGDVIGVRESGRDESCSTVAAVSCDRRPFLHDITSSLHNAMQEDPDVETLGLPTQTTNKSASFASPCPVDKNFSANESPLTSSGTQNTAASTMQLPLPVSLDCVSDPVTDNVLAVEGNLNQSIKGAPAGTDVPNVDMLSHDGGVCATQFMTDSSSTMTQVELGQPGNGVMAVQREEILRKQIELEQKKQQIHLMQMQLTQQLAKCQDLSSVKDQNHQGKDKGHDLNEGQGHLFANVNNNNVNVITDGNNMQIGKISAVVTNFEFERQYDSAMVQFEPRTQGTLPGYQQGLDVNSNITVSNASLTTTLNTVTDANFSKCDEAKVEKCHVVSSKLSAGPKPTPSLQKHPRDRDEMVTPHILRNKSDIEIKQDLMDRESDIGGRFANVTLQQERVQGQAITEADAVLAPSALHGSVTKQGDRLYSKIVIPLWTPLAFKAVAKQQSGIDETHSIVAKQQTGSDEKSKSVARPLLVKEKNIEASKLDFVNVKDLKDDSAIITEEKPSHFEPLSTTSDGHTKVQSVETTSTNKVSPHMKRSAFRAISHSRTMLTPSIGSLSLKGNIDSRMKSVDPQVEVRGHGKSLCRLALRTANERYHEALLDEEVALFACRLTYTSSSSRERDCYNPMAKILMEGDEMHFVPIDDHEDRSPTLCVRYTDSAFSKYTE